MDFNIPLSPEFDFGYLLLIITSIMLIITVIQIIFCQDLVKTTILLSVFSLFISICYLLMDAPDVAMTEVALGACLSTMILLSVIRIFIKKVSKNVESALTHVSVSKKIFKIIMAIILCAVFIFILADIGLELATYGNNATLVHNHISKYYIENTANEVGINSIVAAILASYRGYDTLGETTVILIAGLSIILILSKKENGTVRKISNN